MDCGHKGPWSHLMTRCTFMSETRQENCAAYDMESTQNQQHLICTHSLFLFTPPTGRLASYCMHRCASVSSLYSTAPPLPLTLITPFATFSPLCLTATAASDMFTIFVWMLISPHPFFPLSPVAAPAQESSTWFMGCASASGGLSPHRRARDLDPVTCCVHCLDEG